MLPLKIRGTAFEDLCIIVPLSAFFLLWCLGCGSLASWDEAIYAAVAKEIVLRGDWLRLTLNGVAWVDKPPLGIWATAFFYKLFGISETTARLFSALCGLCLVVVTYYLGRRVLGRWVGFLGALVLLSSSHYLRFARFGMLDAPVTLFMALALYFFWCGREKKQYFLLSGVMIGLGYLTKSFTACLVFPIIWTYCLVAGELEILSRRSYWNGIFLAALIVIPWIVYQSMYLGHTYTQEAFVKHLFLRSAQSLEGHAGNYYFYIRTLINKYHPWILVGIFSAPFFLFKSFKEKSRPIQFLTAWMFVIFIIITLMQTKLPWYVFPVYPALSLSVATVLARVFKESHKNLVSLLFLAILTLHIPYSHLFQQDYSRPIKELATILQKEIPEGEPLNLYNYHESPAVSFYVGRRADYLDDEASFVAAASQKKFYCLISEEDLSLLESRLPDLGVTVQGRSKNRRFLAK